MSICKQILGFDPFYNEQKPYQTASCLFLGLKPILQIQTRNEFDLLLSS